MRAITHLACVTVLLVAHAGCHTTSVSLTETPAADNAPPSAVAQQIERRGYAVRKREVGAPTAWETGTLRMQTKRTTWFRAQRPMRDETNTYCRFQLLEEGYDSEDDARSRLRDIRRVDPEATAEEELISALRDGFRIGTNVYIIATDGVLFEAEVRRLVAELGASTDGAEVAKVHAATLPN